MTPKILHTFNSTTSIGVNEIPLNAIILVEQDAYGDPRIFILTSKVGITATTTIGDVLNGTNWSYPVTYSAADIAAAYESVATTSNVTEGSNLYYTETRANTAIDARVDVSFVNSLGVNANTLNGVTSNAFATATQGTTADSALQSSDIGSTIQAYDSVLDGTTASYTTAEETKLAGIEASATADQTAAQIEAVVNHDNLQGFVANEHVD